LNHVPFLCYGGTYRDPKGLVYQLFGHVHSGRNAKGEDIERLKYLFPTQYDVGVDNNDYTPISWYEVEKKIGKQLLKSKFKK
jgi:calcineurin-like phosphoesterase family protein